MGPDKSAKVLLSISVGIALLCVLISEGSGQVTNGPQKIKIKTIEDLINIGFDSLFPEEPLNNETAFKSIKFRLYTDPKNTSNYEELTLDDIGSEKKNSLQPNVPYKIMIHGFLAHCDKRIFPKSLVQAYLDKTEETKSPMNIICVDWGLLANPSALPNPLLYGESVKSTMMVGEKTADLLATLYNKELVRDFSDVHIIASSLGSHIAGVTGHMLKRNWGLPSKIGRITALDPAGLFYREKKAIEEKLTEDDAEFVEVIHTNMGQLGLEGKIGHADFYPNGGRLQERCYHYANPITILAEQLSGRCSHLIAATYYKESIEHGNITACRAESWHEFREMTRTTGCKERVGFGENCPKSARGQFFLMM